MKYTCALAGTVRIERTTQEKIYARPLFPFKPLPAVIFIKLKNNTIFI